MRDHLGKGARRTNERGAADWREGDGMDEGTGWDET
jgi:hypothetical protein